MLRKVEGILFFEAYATWHPKLLQIASSLNVKAVCVPNWEWFRGDDAMWRLCDLFACPTRFTVGIIKSYGWQKAIYVPWSLDLLRFPARTVAGPARIFIHNAGLVDQDDRKGTRDAIRAFKRVRRKDIKLIVRMQKAEPMPAIDDRIEIHVGNLDNPEELYQAGDVAIQPSKMEGIGFMVIEPMCSGLPVITTDYPPMNEFIRQPEMLVKPKWFKRRAFANHWVKHAHLRLARISDLSAKIDWCAGNDMASIGAGNRQLAKSLFDPAQLQRHWAEALSTIR